jgi:hypothetical protein
MDLSLYFVLNLQAPSPLPWGSFVKFNPFMPFKNKFNEHLSIDEKRQLWINVHCYKDYSK